jgi:ketosteroid isomerase-like protein
MDTTGAGSRGHASIEVIVAVHAAFNARRLDELEILMREDVELFVPLSLRLKPSSEKGVAALRATVTRALAVAPDLRIELERTEVVGDLVVVICLATATGTDGKRYEWPLRVLVGEADGRITRYIVHAPHADIAGDAHAFTGRISRDRA